jgi:hypothetical protein
MLLGGVLGMGKSRTVSSPLPMIPFRRSLDLPLSRSILLTSSEREGSSSGVIIPESPRCELDEVGENMVASPLPPPPNESELVELNVGKVAVYPRGRRLGVGESINAAEPKPAPEPLPFPLPPPIPASVGLFVRSIARLSKLGRRVRVNAPGRMGEAGWFCTLGKGVELGGGGNWIEDVDGRDVDETTGVEETSIGQGLVGVAGRTGGVEGRGKGIGWVGCRNDILGFPCETENGIVGPSLFVLQWDWRGWTRRSRAFQTQSGCKAVRV